MNNISSNVICMEITLSKPNPQKMLQSVSFEKGFHFTNEKGLYTGFTAQNLMEFFTKLEIVDVNSILFHYPRGDFQKWIQDTLGEKVLAETLFFASPDLSGEDLRRQLLNIIKNRISELQTTGFEE